MATQAEVEDLPRANVKRVVKSKLAELTNNRYDDERRFKEVIVNKEALMAFAESARIFIHYLSATANDICRESKRQTISADDVLKAVEDIDFMEFAEPLRAALEGFRKDIESKKSETKKRVSGKKRKLTAAEKGKQAIHEPPDSAEQTVEGGITDDEEMEDDFQN